MLMNTTISRYSICLLATLTATQCCAAEPAAPRAKIDGPIRDEDKGVLRWTVTSQFQHGPNDVEVLLPEKFDLGRKYRVLYVLPVEPGIGGRYGDGLQEIRKIDAHNRHGLICVAPAFDAVPWFMDHATDAKMRHESYMLRVVVPMIESRYPTLGTADGRLLLGFSKSGWGAFTLLLRNPDVFGYAAAWDSPMMLQEPDWRQFGIDRAAGTVENFRKYQPAALFQSQAKHFRDRTQLALLGHKSFGPGGGSAYRDEHTHTRWAHEEMQSQRISHAYNNEVKVAHAWHTGWVEPAVNGLMKMVAAP